ncbi:MAG: hypothetical protein ABIS21_07370 [Acidimicrobiales bacterium]
MAAGLVLGALLDAMRDNGGTKAGAVLGVLAAAAFSLRSLAELGQTGQTLGKRHVGVRLVGVRDRRAVGAPVGNPAYLWRA